MIKQADFAAVAALDLDRIKTKLCHPESGEGWSRARADAAEVQYRRFLYLMKAYPREQTVPTVEADTFWHYHILDTVKYAADCHAVFGYFLHHDPAVGLAGASEAVERARRAARLNDLYEEAFGPPAENDHAYCGRARAAYCGAHLAPMAWNHLAATSGIPSWRHATPPEQAAPWRGMATPVEADAAKEPMTA